MNWPIDLINSLPPWAGSLVMSLIGGIVKVLQRLKGHGYRNRWGVAFDLGAAGFTGLLTWLALRKTGIDSEALAAMAGIAGHGGAVTLAAFGRWFSRTVERLTGIQLEESDLTPLDDKHNESQS